MRRKLLISVLLSGVLILFATSAMAGPKSDTWLGVYAQTIDEDLMEAFNLDHNRGALIKQVVPDSPADEAGLKPGDIIIKLGDKELIDSDDLSKTVMALNPGNEVDILIVRDGKKKTIAATLGSGDKDDFAPKQIFKWFGKQNQGGPHSKFKTFTFDEDDFKNSYIGVNLETLTDQLGEYFGVEDGNGILITEVIENSPAKEAGLKAGDVIIKVDDEEVVDISDIQKAVRQKEKGEEVEITLLRNKKKKELTVEVAEPPESLNQPFMYHLPDLDNFHSFTPHKKGMFYGDGDDKVFTGNENKEAMKKMQNEIDELKKELKNIQDKIN